MERVQKDDLDTKVVVTTHNEVGFLGECFNQMTAELRQKEILFNANIQLKEQLAKIQALETALREQAVRDPLTGLFNRRYMEEMLHQELARASRRNKHLSIVILDLDHLKEINDRYGHVEGGDQALLCLSRTIGALCRTEDTFCRYAGDEFLVILYDTAVQVAFRRAIEWKEAVSKTKITARGTEFGITFSAGIAEFPAHGLDAEKLIQRADKALYKAKDARRNCVMVYDVNEFHSAETAVNPNGTELNGTNILHSTDTCF
jgi:diguanylate cyclase (GGDEF)-like protein